MTEQHNPQHWSQLDTEEQIRFWQGIDNGHVGSFLVSPEKKRTRRRRGEHSTKPKCENPSWFRPSHYKALGGQLGHAYNRLVKKDPLTGQHSLRMHMSLHPFYVRERQRAGRKYAFRPEKQRLLDALWPVLFGPVATDPALPCYAVLDAGRVPGLPDLLAGSGLKHACLFRDEGGGDLQQAAPWIVEMRDENSFVRNLFTRGAAPWQMWDRRPGIFLRSAASLDDLRRHFRKFVRLYSQQTQSWHFFRFYTPEIARTVGQTAGTPEDETTTTAVQGEKA